MATAGGAAVPEWVPPWAEGLLTALVNSALLEWALAALALAAGWYLGKLAARTFGRRVARRFQRPSVTRTVLRLIRTGGVLLGVVWAMAVLGVPITSLALSVTVFSAVLGIVLAPIVGSVINGLFVLADQPFEIGDMVELAESGRRGFIEDITLRYTKIFTLDNTFLVIPNATVRERDILNYSAEDERVRLTLSTTVTYEGNLDAARNAMEASAREVEEVIDGGPSIRVGSARYPAAPTCYVDEFADHGIKITLRYWARQPYKLLTIRSKVQERVWERIEAADDIEVAYPHSHLMFDETSGEARVDVRSRDTADRERRGRDRRRPDRE
jgi:small-conductance mechanosensitive channel